jgi:hypothetical protein
MPFDNYGDEVIIKLDKAKADSGFGDEIKVTMEQLEGLNEILKDDGFKLEMPKGLMESVKMAGSAFSDFAATERAIKEKADETRPWAHVRSAEMLVHYPRTAKRGEAYEDNTVNPGWLNFHNVKDLLARFFVTVHSQHGKVRNWRDLCIGITSLDNEGDGHLPMFDYDGSNIKTRVKKDVKQLQKQFGLGDATIFETRKGLHVYFFSNLVEWGQYQEMMDSVGICKGFKQASERNGYAVLRVSAKYTEFDILPYKVIISPYRGENRPGRKAALIRELLRLGQECGTHLASLYPQWCMYREDMEPWKVAAKRKPGRRVRKVSKEEYLEKKFEHAKKVKIKEEKYKMMYNSPVLKQDNNNYYVQSTGTTTSTWTTTTTTGSGNF